MKYEMKEHLYWVYILECENSSYYTGYTTNLVRRFQEHLNGTAKCKYTRSFKPLSVVQCWQVNGSKSVAMKMERYLKKISKKEKIHIIQHPHLLTQLFECSATPKLLEPEIKNKIFFRMTRNA
jgi:putative endonuclease